MPGMIVSSNARDLPAGLNQLDNLDVEEARRRVLGGDPAAVPPGVQ